MTGAPTGARDWAWPLRRELRPAAWYVLCELIDRGPGPVAAASRDLAAKVGLGRDAVRTAVRELEAAGVIERTTARGEGGRFDSSVYAIRPAPENPSPATPAEQPSPRAQPTSSHHGDQLSLLADNHASA